MSEFRSCMKDMIEEFIRYRKVCNKWNEASYELNLKLFDHYCAERYPLSTRLTQEMVDSWCAQRESESNNGCISRIYVIVTFIKYLRERDLTTVQPPAVPAAENRLYTPHFFTEEELRLFFEACDNYKPYNFRTANHLAIKYTLPVIFRLLYSSGMRTTEARELVRKDVDLNNGVVSIRNTKGYEEHFIVLHDSMLELMKEYDRVIDDLYPDRKYFFPCGKNGHIDRSRLAYYFRIMWKQVSNEKALPYELRHNYAITNINKLVDAGMSFNDNMIYLSKSMGHTSAAITAKYYYRIVPELSRILQEQTQDSFDEIIPEVEYEEIQ